MPFGALLSWMAGAPRPERRQSVHNGGQQRDRRPRALQSSLRRASTGLTKAFRGQIQESPQGPPPPPPPPRNPPTNAVYFDEGEGYLLVKTLAAGVDGSASLVRSRWNGKLYVRKEDLHTKSCPPDAAFRFTPPAETTNTLAVDHIKSIYQVHGWTRWIYRDVPRYFNVTYWKYYDLGSLNSFYTSYNQEHNRPVPELWCVIWLVRMLDTLIYIHESNIVHRDCHIGNWLLETTDFGVPNIVLGDFGRSVPRETMTNAEWERRCCADFYLAMEAIRFPLDCGFNTDSGTVFATAYSRTSHAAVGLLNRLATAVTRTEYQSMENLHRAIKTVRNRGINFIDECLDRPPNFNTIPPSAQAPTVPQYMTGYETINDEVREKPVAYKQWRNALVYDDADVYTHTEEYCRPSESHKGDWHQHVRGQQPPRWTVDGH